ncbi:MFS transporter [Gilvimarinus xylanilyticus]|uniref:MFS transporter n=1 Tax=Gilvimarinus xylanilyticus TaxID=2944139 RepID=A0A9X2I090_9GAMM|nr:MFS transporter [Gilvimarinus xylanilyticus]MCP8897831.1 MFS transporter [Gilvimarinus xylanilyticus]
MRQWWSVYCALPANVWVLFTTLALVMTSIPLMVLISGLIGLQLAPEPELATLPLALAVTGTAFSTLPAAWLMQNLGRRGGGFVGLLLSFLGAIAGAFACQFSSFTLLLVAAVLLGAAMAFYQQFRFAALEAVSAAQAGPAVSVIMFSGVIAAFLGPELAVWGRSWPGSAEYTGAFVLLAVVMALAALVFSRFRAVATAQESIDEPARPLRTLIVQPVFLQALAAAAIGYGVMSFLMTSTPISMHEMHGHSVADAKWVIQSHLLAMFVPSLFAGALLKSLGVQRLMLLGSVLYALVLALGLLGVSLMHYWGALVLLGIGWNFLFLSGTSLLPGAYRPAEKFKVQAANDFVIFAVQAVASLSAGWVLYQFGWRWQVLSCLVPVVLLLVTSWVVLKRRA